MKQLRINNSYMYKWPLLICVFHKQFKNSWDKCTGIIFAILFFFFTLSLHIIALQ